MNGEDMGEGPVDEAIRTRFETAWIEGRPEPIEGFLPARDDPAYLPTLQRLVQIELQFAWQSWSKARQQAGTVLPGETEIPPPHVESYLRRFGCLSRPEILVRLVEQEYSVRRACGEEVSADEYRRRFPDLEIPHGRLESEIGTVVERGSDVQLAETFAPGQAGEIPVEQAMPGTFGNYELLGEIGKGGMGIVYRARQRAADRIVALKVVRRDRLEALPRDTQTSAIDRFWHEAQAAARLEHDNIVTVYEVGEAEGQPFFSMRYVEGRSLSEILRDGPIENRRAAAYFEPVARAVHEAHSMGILHRDLKPQNILVDAKTDRALVADFGLAKLSEGSEELTRAGEVMGTPSYMSPEQAKDSAGVSAGADIYALGATLYHVLTGRPPFHAATPVETLRQVIDEEPVPLRQLNPSIHRDLETICLKCLQKEPSRRYASSELLADDLGRYLRGEPILARPVGPIGRTVRWCRRNPVTATLIASTFAFLVLALVATLVGYSKTSAALADTEEARKKTAAALEVAEEARQESEESFWQLRKAVDNFYTRVSEDTLLNQPGMQPLRRELLQQALDYYRQFLSQRGDDPTIRDDLAVTHFREGRITEEITSPEAALASYRRARRMQQQLVAERPNDLDRLQVLGNTLSAMGRALHRQHKLAEARRSHQEAAAIRERLVEEAPGQGEYVRTLANSYMNLGLIEKELFLLEREADQCREARRQLGKAQALRLKLLSEGGDDPDLQRDLGKGYYNRAVLETIAGDRAAARQNLQAAVAAFEGLLERDPHDLDNKHHLARCCRCLADEILQDPASTADDLGSALELYEKALGPMEMLALANPEVAQYQTELAFLQMNRGALEHTLQRPEEALESFLQALGTLQDLVENNPGVPQYRAYLAGLHMMLGDLRHAQQQSYAAIESFKGAYETLRGLIEHYPRVPEYRRDYAVTVRELAVLYAEIGQEKTARENLAKLRAHLGELVESFPDTPEFQALLEQTEADLAGMDAPRPKDP